MAQHRLDLRARSAALAILFASLFVASLSASSQHEQQQQQQASLAARSLIQKRAPHWPSTIDNSFDPLYERPTLYVSPPARGQSHRDEANDDDDDDDRFLRQLKVAAEYLDERLAERQREQQQRALLGKLGRFVGPSWQVSGPAYSLSDSNGGGGGASGDELGRDVVVVAPGESDSQFGEGGALSGPLEPHYRVLEDARQPQAARDDNADDDEEREQQARLTYHNYKQLLKTLLLDKAQPTEATAAAQANKRDSGPLEERAATDLQSADLGDDDVAPLPGAQVSGGTHAPKLTTLLEDEDEGKDAAKTAPAQNATTAKPAVYGKVVYEKTGGAKNASASSSSVFERMYAQLSHYLPFMNQISILRNPQGATSANSTGAGHDEVMNEHRHGQLRVRVSGPASGDHEDQHDDQRDREAGAAGEKGPHAKQSVSVSTPKRHLGAAGGDKQEEDKEREQDKQQKAVKVSVALKDAQVRDHEEPGAQEIKSENSKRLSSGAGGPSGERDQDVNMNQVVPVLVSPQAHEAQAARYSHLMRAPTGGQDAESLMGKYIYAPTQHYYLSSVLPSTVASGAPHHLLSAGGARHFRPGDEVYGSYGDLGGPMKAAYAYQKDPSMMSSGAGNANLASKTNDLYFLIMVGAFCVMAMAVVLAVGAFAYRVQQSRKSSQDQDYPTYGVVGPNNMSGKCGGAPVGAGGASAFTMGGYFMGPPGDAGGGAGSKSGSARHLADVYGPPSAGHQHHGSGGSDSGLNSLGRSSRSNKKQASSSASSLNNEHAGSGRPPVPASGGFHMGAAAAVSQDAARMYHYQSQKQQMINSAAGVGGRHTSASDLDSEDENDDGSYTVYECPGLASAHEMEIKNPLFNDDQTP